MLSKARLSRGDADRLPHCGRHFAIFVAVIHRYGARHPPIFRDGRPRRGSLGWPRRPTVSFDGSCHGPLWAQELCIFMFVWMAKPRLWMRTGIHGA
jgi:hypothetical protein